MALPGLRIPRLYIADLPSDGIWLDKGWKYQEGNNQTWAQVNYDDRKCQALGNSPQALRMKFRTR
jgi:hypothetical protein